MLMMLRPTRRALCTALRFIAPFAFPMLLAAATVELKKGPEQIEVLIDGQPFTTYFFHKDVAKPYLMPLRSASGLVVTRGFPVKNDVSMGNPKASSFEPHQRPLYFGHGNVDGLDFWQEPVFDHYYEDHGHQAYGHAVFKSVDATGSGSATASVKAEFSLRDPSEREIGEMSQTLSFSGDKENRIIDCAFVMRATAGPLVMGDTKEGAFGIRLAPELSGAAVQMTNSHGAQGEKQIWGKTANWVNYNGAIGGTPVGVAVFDHPTSFRHPTTWHARAYGLFAANPFGLRAFTKDPKQDGSWTIDEGKSLLFRYRVVIHEGPFSAESLDRQYQSYSQIP